MLRLLLFPTLLIAGSTLFSAGCRSCSTCHDYDPPVNCCQCGTCGGHRAGSAAGGYVSSEGFVYEDEAGLQQPGDMSAGPTCPCQSGN